MRGAWHVQIHQTDDISKHRNGKSCDSLARAALGP